MTTKVTITNIEGPATVQIATSTEKSFTPVATLAKGESHTEYVFVGQNLVIQEVVAHETPEQM